MTVFVKEKDGTRFLEAYVSIIKTRNLKNEMLALCFNKSDIHHCFMKCSIDSDHVMLE